MKIFLNCLKILYTITANNYLCACCSITEPCVWQLEAALMIIKMLEFLVGLLHLFPWPPVKWRF